MGHNRTIGATNTISCDAPCSAIPPKQSPRSGGNLNRGLANGGLARKAPIRPKIRETLCESGRWIGALKKRGRVLKKRGKVLKKRGRVLKKRRLVRGTGGGALLQKGGGGFLRRGGVLKKPVGP